jgi:DNA-binding response OmpR family regulator
VELVRWPSQSDRRGHLARSGVPCLLLVEPGAPLPGPVGPAEDWIRMPAAEEDVAARAFALCRRLAAAAGDPLTVVDGVAHRSGRSVPLQAGEAALLEQLLGADGVVARAELERAAWPGGAPAPRSLEALVYRLRGRLAPLDVHIVASRGRGFTIDVGPIATSARGIA